MVTKSGYLAIHTSTPQTLKILYTVWSTNDGLSIYWKPVRNLPETCQKPAKNQFTKVSGSLPADFRRFLEIHH